MNSCNFVGTLGKDWDVQYNNEGKPRAKNSLAIRKFNSETLWVNLVIFGAKVDPLVKNTGKGDKLGVSTQLDINEYEKDGQKNYFHSFIINDFTFCGSKKDGQQSQQPQQGFQQPQQQGNFQQQNSPKQQGCFNQNQGGSYS